ncbi:class I SAM-dependent methyltransferase [Adlercreutzia sp. R25]|uniref:Class I SAM-dependent methyltransferase n=1 Tax=Adlercreutzia shanghongiae TaxID=3111773 RepID=A0ABU6IZ00_9ACTN|nr:MULTISPECIES: class I SAM-dependent methyltransferase [unclassified Adlercreutzia]MEC4272815.1 class I SAM-dependent methyltransferase [Adlercreutzia sp. R25]MEC4295071.1 class I SAM-dependent methyltransferase [Adlercreutzia sp. R22]
MSRAANESTAAARVGRPHDAAHPNAYPAAVVRQLSALTTEFYAREAASFSVTRQAPWHGWEKAWEVISEQRPSLAAEPLAVLDVGCGNLRFERFLATHTRGPVAVCALDNCTALAEDGTAPLSERFTLEFQETDLVEHLLNNHGTPLANPGTCDIAVAFGLMHHVPTFALRTRILQELISALRPGGFALVSFWQFLNDPRLAAKAEAVTAAGRAEHNLPLFQENDFLLGWQEAERVYRFCHHTPDAEIDALLANVQQALAQAHSSSPTFRELARFSADGKPGNLNRYVILQRH